ncbi:LysE family translocator, partial [bacterium]|nr:LysE family translocator [bacterium]
MDIKTLLGMSFVCALGAISPGPSLVVVLRNTVSGGRILGVMTGIGHGTGLTVYAFIAVMGLSSALIANEQIFKSLQWAGALVLIWLAFNLITNNSSNLTKSYKSSRRRGFLEGFM